MSLIQPQIFYDGVWNTVACFTEEGWSYKVGPSLNGGLDPGSLTIALDNRDLSMDPSNPLSPLYRKIGRNTSVRLAVAGAIGNSGEASSWKPTRSINHTVTPARGRAQTELTAEGLLRRIGRWDDTLRSPMNRQISSYGSSLRGFYPLEDPSRSQNLANIIAGGQAGTFSGAVTLDGDDGSGGSSGAVVLGSDGRIAGRFVVNPTYSGYQVCFALKFSQLPSSGTYIAMFQWYDTNGYIWYWRVNNTAFEIACYNSDGTLKGSTTVLHSVDITQWVRYRCKITMPSAGTINYDPAWQQQDGGVVGTGGSFTGAGGTTGQALRWEAVANTYTQGAAFNMVFLTTDTAIDILGSYDASAAFSGYLGEKAGDRFARLMTETGLAYLQRGTSSLSPTMGRQQSSSLIDLLAEIQQTDGGLIYDDPITVTPGTCRVTFRMNNHMLNQTPVLALTYGTNIAQPFDKVIDDQRLANDITGKNWDGTEARVEDSTSYMGTQAPPVGVGRYTSSLDVSFRFPAGITDRINWELRNNTIDRPRYAQVTIDLLNPASSSLTATVAALRPGDLITITGVEPQVIPLIIINIERSGGAVTDTVKLNCLPGDNYETGTYDDGVHRYDSASTTLSSGITSGATSVPIFSADPMDKWSTTPGYGIWIGPERCTVTACTAGSASGTGWAQTMTVTRGANGVAIAHLSGEAVNVYQPARYSMKIVSNP